MSSGILRVSGGSAVGGDTRNLERKANMACGKMLKNKRCLAMVR